MKRIERSVRQLICFIDVLRVFSQVKNNMQTTRLLAVCLLFVVKSLLFVAITPLELEQ